MSKYTTQIGIKYPPKTLIRKRSLHGNVFQRAHFNATIYIIHRIIKPKCSIPARSTQPRVSKPRRIGPRGRIRANRGSWLSRLVCRPGSCSCSCSFFGCGLCCDIILADCVASSARANAKEITQSVASLNVGVAWCLEFGILSSPLSQCIHALFLCLMSQCIHTLFLCLISHRSEARDRHKYIATSTYDLWRNAVRVDRRWKLAVGLG